MLFVLFVMEAAGRGSGSETAPVRRSKTREGSRLGVWSAGAVLVAGRAPPARATVGEQAAGTIIIVAHRPSDLMIARSAIV